MNKLWGPALCSYTNDPAPGARKLSSGWPPNACDKFVSTDRGPACVALLVSPVPAPARIEDVGRCEVVGQHLAFEFFRQCHVLFSDEFRDVETEPVTLLRDRGFLQGPGIGRRRKSSDDDHIGLADLRGI